MFVQLLTIARHRRQPLSQDEDRDAARLRRTLYDRIGARLAELNAKFVDSQVGEIPLSAFRPEKTIARKLACRFASKKASNEEKLCVGIARFPRSA